MIKIDPFNVGHHIKNTYDINIFGGMTHLEEPVNFTEIYAIKHAVWLTKSNMYGGGRYKTAASGDSINSYIYGGLGASPPPVTLQYYSIGDIWNRKANIPLDPNDSGNTWSASSFDEKGYVFGGETESPPHQGSKNTYEYTYNIDSWTQKTSFLVQRFSHCAATIEQKIYVYAGIRNTTMVVRVVEEYSVAFDIWAMKALMLQNVYEGAGCSLNQWLFTFGGLDYSLFETMRYNAVGDTWEMKSDIPVSCKDNTAISFDSNIYLMGSGDGAPEIVFPTLYLYNPFTDTWLNLDNNFLYPRYNFVATVSME